MLQKRLKKYFLKIIIPNEYLMKNKYLINNT